MKRFQTILLREEVINIYLSDFKEFINILEIKENPESIIQMCNEFIDESKKYTYIEFIEKLSQHEILVYNEIIDIITKNSGTVYAIQLSDSFIDSLKICTYSKAINAISEIISEYASENLRCKKCGVELVYDTWYEVRDYQGFYAQEPCTDLRCPECDPNKNDNEDF